MAKTMIVMVALMTISWLRPVVREPVSVPDSKRSVRAFVAGRIVPPAIIPPVPVMNRRKPPVTAKITIVTDRPTKRSIASVFPVLSVAPKAALPSPA
jgi:hypothetical protein